VEGVFDLICRTKNTKTLSQSSEVFDNPVLQKRVRSAGTATSFFKKRFQN
jgi:hypothetical protein